MSAHNVLHELFQAPYMITDPGDGETIVIDRQLLYVPITTASSGETRVIPAATKANLMCTCGLATDGGGDCVVTVTDGYNADDDTTITLGDAGDYFTLISIKIGDDYYWRVIAQEGTNAAVETFSVDALTAGALTVGTTSLALGDMTPGTGISTGTGTICESSVTKVGDLYKTEILIDLTGLKSGDAAGDIIGVGDDTPNCHIGQITAAVNGTIFAGSIACLEAPAGGDPDIDLYSAAESTGAQDAGIATLDETALIDAGDHTAGGLKALSAYPAADEYLYLTCGDVTNVAYSAGILQITLWGK